MWERRQGSWAERKRKTVRAQKQKENMEKKEREEYMELEEDPLLGVGGGGPMGAEIGVEDMGGLLGRRLAGHGLHLEG